MVLTINIKERNRVDEVLAALRKFDFVEVITNRKRSAEPHSEFL